MNRRNVNVRASFFQSGAVWITCCLIVAALPTGCAVVGIGLTYRAYDGPVLPPDQVAVLKLLKSDEICNDEHAGIAVRELDGRKVRYNFGDTLQLLPGKHVVTFTTYAPLTDLSGVPIIQTVMLQAGKTYTATARDRGLTDVSESDNSTFHFRSSWWVDLVAVP